MSKFQIVALKPLAGISKTTQRPYNMLAVSGIFTNDDGTVHLGEVAFMDRPGYPLPTNLVVGQTYVPVVAANSRQGKLQFEITALQLSQPLKAAA
jgi:hypothetical protein